MKISAFDPFSPYLSIFERGANQTIFGGILFLIYGIIFIILAIIYLYDYVSKANYTFDYTFVKENSKKNESEWTAYKHKEILLSDLEVKLSLKKDKGEDGVGQNLSDNFFIIDYNTLLFNMSRDSEGYKIITENASCIIKQGESHTIKMNFDYPFAVIYRCNGTDCSISDEDKIKGDSYYLDFEYRGYNIDHQSETQKAPIEEIPEGYYFRQSIQFLENTNIAFLNWNLVEYKEKKGIFGQLFDEIIGNKNIYYGRQLSSLTTYTGDDHIRDLPTNNTEYWNLIDEKGNHFIVLLSTQNIIIWDYERYTRTAKSIFTSLAEVCALSSTIKNIITLVYIILFAKNYDNYKIVENILKEKLKVNINHKINELKYIKDIDLETKIELKTDLIMNSTEENKIQNENNIEDEDENKIKTNSDTDLATPKFFDFLCNKIYFNCCCGNSNKQNLINSCNEIVSKYISIEKILYNQMKLENLWKDYKWNNPQYESKEKVDLLLDLQGK